MKAKTIKTVNYSGKQIKFIINTEDLDDYGIDLNDCDENIEIFLGEYAGPTELDTQYTLRFEVDPDTYDLLVDFIPKDSTKYSFEGQIVFEDDDEE